MGGGAAEYSVEVAAFINPLPHLTPPIPPPHTTTPNRRTSRATSVRRGLGFRFPWRRTGSRASLDCLTLRLSPEAGAHPRPSAEAFVTLVTSDPYSMGAAALARSLRRHGTTRGLVVMVTPNVSERSR